jgi:type I restriction enzyme R subunit
MTNTVDFREEYISQIPALQLLMNMGYNFINYRDARDIRGNKLSEVVLTDVLRDWMHQHNHIDYRGERVAFSDANIENAIHDLTAVDLSRGLIPENERLYELLTLGTSMEQTIEGNRRSYSLQYIDWKNPANNVYHVTDEFSVQRRGRNDTYRPDIVVFVNGIPLVVIECKRPDKSTQHGGKAVNEGITQTIRNQKMDGIPDLFAYSQIVMAIATTDALYATTATEQKFWQVWKEEHDIEDAVHERINAPLSEADKDELFKYRDNAPKMRRYFDEQERLGRLPTVQDKTLYAMLRPERLLELIYQYIVFDNGIKKITRYQQYFAIKATLDRVAHVRNDRTRNGGVIWHTTGSGKSLTMVMLSKALALHPNVPNPRVVIVTDRINLDEQIYGTFRACGKQAHKATSGKDLAKLVQDSSAEIITTIIDKFETVAQKKIIDNNPDVFVLVDESHRGQYGQSHAMMRRVFKQGCYIGFTGTPLLKKDKTTAQKFGGFIHKYTMRQAVEDGAVLPLLYEGRMVDLDINKSQLDLWFERRTADLNDEQRTDLKRKLSRADELGQVSQRLQVVAYDIAQDYIKNHRGTGLKAQLATSSKLVAIRYYQLLRDEGIDCAVVISAPDNREGNTNVSELDTPEVEQFWRDMMNQHGSERAYNDNTLRSFADEDGIEIIIVVDKLLVGFDQPRNHVLYVDKPLKDHGLLQAIARVNRLYPNKTHGIIVDYRGVLGKLNEAMETYNALEGYDVEDVAGTVIDISKILQELPQHHEQLWAFFQPVENKGDLEALSRYLEPEDRRDAFYDYLNQFATSLKLALGSEVFYEETPQKRIRTYKQDLKFFHQLRQTVKQRYAETVDYRDYEARIRKLMDQHISAEGMTQVTELVNIFDVDAFEQEVAKIDGNNGRADTILHRLKKTAVEKMEQDPAFYRKFSQMIEEVLQAYRDGRIDDAEKLQHATDLLNQLYDNREQLPTALQGAPHAPVFYRLFKEQEASPFVQQGDDILAELALIIEATIEERKIRDWTTNEQVKNDMINHVEDVLFDFMQQRQIQLASTEVDYYVEVILDTSIKRDQL